MSTDPFAGLPAPDAAEVKPAIRVVSADGAIVTDPKAVPYKLEWPLEFDGVDYREVRIHRVNATARANFVRSAGPRGLANVRQLVRTVEGKLIPAEVMDGMQWEDGEAIIDMVEPMISKFFPPPPPLPTFAGDQHHKTLFLEAPVDYDGKLYDRIEVRRLTAREISTFLARPDQSQGIMPAFFDEDGKAVPEAVLAALSFEDTESVGQAMDAFMPRALRADRAPASTSAPETGETSPRP